MSVWIVLHQRGCWWIPTGTLEVHEVSQVVVIGSVHDVKCLRMLAGI